MESVESQVLRQIEVLPKGELLLPSDFSELGSSEAVRLAFFRLERAGVITRVAKGIYVRPKKSKLIGEILPTAEEIADAIVRRDRIRAVPAGSYALNALGLSTQVIMNIVILTDGAPREIKIGKRTIKFKKATPKNLLAKGKISRLVIQALKEIGKGKVTGEEEDKIIELLRAENKMDLKHDIALAPVWIQKIMKKAV